MEGGAVVLYLGKRFFKDDVDTEILASFFHGLRDAGVDPGNERSAARDDGDFGPEAFEEESRLHSYRAGAHNDNRVGESGQFNDVVARPVW